MENKLDLPLEGRGWTITLPMEEWGSLVQAATECVETVGMSGNPGDAVEHLDRALQASLRVAQAMPPLEVPE